MVKQLGYRPKGTTIFPMTTKIRAFTTRPILTDQKCSTWTQTRPNEAKFHSLPVWCPWTTNQRPGRQISVGSILVKNPADFCGCWSRFQQISVGSFRWFDSLIVWSKFHWNWWVVHANAFLGFVLALGIICVWRRLPKRCKNIEGDRTCKKSGICAGFLGSTPVFKCRSWYTALVPGLYAAYHLFDFK